MEKGVPVSVWPEWQLVEKIGEGSFGKVYKAQRTERGRTFYSAIKIISIPGNKGELDSVRSEMNDEQSTREYFRNLVEDCVQEIYTMEHFCGNSHIVSFEDFKVVEYLDEIGWDIYIRMEYLTSFMDYCTGKELTEKEVIKLGCDLAMALIYCRKLNIIHRDVKPENIFVSRFGDFKLGDFGIARELERTMSGFSKKGTYSYMAPEMYKGEKYDSGVDIYSLGIVLYKLMNHNRLPFMNLEKQFITYRDKENALTRRMSGEQMEPPAEAGRLFAQIILKACAFDPAKRYQTPEEFYRDLDDLKHGRMTGRAQKTSEIKQKDRPAPTSSGETEPKSRSQAYKTATVQPKQVHTAETVKVSQPVQQADSQKDREQNIAQSARIMAARRRRRKKEKMLRRALVAAVVGLAVLIAGGLYIRISMHNSSDAPGNSLVDILDNDKYGIDKGDSKDFTTAIENIKDRATTITDDLDSYDWVGSEGTVLRYLKRVKTVENADGNLDIESQCMKALIYPAESGEKKYEEYFYWDEKLFFAYIWYDETAEYYYYDDGELIRWIDANGTCHDNETDNDEYVKRGEKYWNNSLKALKGEGTKTEDGISD